MNRTYARRMAQCLRNADWDHYTDPVALKKADRTGHTPQCAKQLALEWCELVENTAITWSHVDSAEFYGIDDAWDLTVPGPYTFALSDGTIVQDTMNLHTPVSKQAVQNVIQKCCRPGIFCRRKHEGALSSAGGVLARLVSGNAQQTGSETGAVSICR